MKLELPLFANIPKTSTNHSFIIDYDECYRMDSDALYETAEMIEHMRELLEEISRVPRGFLGNYEN